MRCNKCNVDLANEYTVCPLCGEKAADEAPVLENIITAPYPKYSDALLKKKHCIKSDYPFKYVLRVSMVICTVLWIAYFITKNPLPVLAGYSLLSLNGLLYFALAVKEKGRLLHYAVSLTACAVFEIALLVLSTIFGIYILQAVMTVCICMLQFLVLLITKKDRMTAQLGATFNI